MGGRSTAPHKQWSTLPEGFAQKPSFRVFECEKRQREPGLDWPGGWEFLSKANRCQILG